MVIKKKLKMNNDSCALIKSPYPFMFANFILAKGSCRIRIMPGSSLLFCNLPLLNNARCVFRYFMRQFAVNCFKFYGKKALFFDLLRIAILAAVGAIVRFTVSVLLKLLLQHIKKK